MDDGNYFRRCHKCGGVIEGDHKQNKIDECLFCDFPLAPFCFFDDKNAPVVSEGGLRPAFDTKDYNPLTGLSAYWD